MKEPAGDVDNLVSRVEGGDREALAELFALYRDRLRRMVRLRLDRRLQGRVDSSDVIQEAYLDASRRVDGYIRDPDRPFYLWLRFLTVQKLLQIHRAHFGTKMREAGRDVSIFRGALPQASSVEIAAQLLGRHTSPSQAAIRAELKIQIQEALNSMDAIDREVLALRHFEELTNNETAEVLGLSKAAASNRYVRALKRLKKILEPIPGLLDGYERRS